MLIFQCVIVSERENIRKKKMSARDLQASLNNECTNLNKVSVFYERINILEDNGVRCAFFFMNAYKHLM